MKAFRTFCNNIKNLKVCNFDLLDDLERSVDFLIIIINEIVQKHNKI